MFLLHPSRGGGSQPVLGFADIRTGAKPAAGFADTTGTAGSFATANSPAELNTAAVCASTAKRTAAGRPAAGDTEHAIAIQLQTIQRQSRQSIHPVQPCKSYQSY